MFKTFIQSLFSQRISVRESDVSDMRASLLRHQRIFRSSHGYGYFDWDLQKQKMDWSGGYWKYLGYTDEDVEVISMSSNYFDYVHPEDVGRMQEAIWKLFKAQTLMGEVTYRVRKKNGGYIWTEIRADATRDEHGWVTFVSGIAFDVTKQKQMQQALQLSEERHARILQSSNDGIWEWVLDQDGFHYSARCWEHLGYTENHEAIAQGVDRMAAWRKRMHPDDLLQFDRILSQHIRKQGPFDVEYRIRGKGDRWFWIRARGQMVFNEKGEPVRMSGSNMDITELKKAEERVIKAKEDAEKASQAKSEFLSSMSHELRTPLNAILGYSQILAMDESLASVQRAHVAEITRAGDILSRLIKDCLDLARIEAGHLDFIFKPLAPCELIQRCLGMVQNLAIKRNINLVFYPGNFSSVTITADQTRLEQVLLNLITNAVKYNRDRGRVNIACAIEADTFFRILVQDTGKGIALEKQHQIFQPFNRLGEENSKIEGSGVGLVITQRLVQQMGGRIDFSSQEGVGSRFWIDIPMRQEVNNPPVLGANAEAAEIKPNELEIGGRRRILYIEDSPSNQRLMEHLLGRFPQLELQLAGDALKGLFYARTEYPDLIIMDINLPGMDGFEALEVLQSDLATAHIPVIALSANAMSHDVEKGLKAGFVSYLTKPLEFGLLIEVFNRCLK
ncbi:MAG TPA: PAS domain-containing protein [Cellvibrionaceae bacterium]